MHPGFYAWWKHARGGACGVEGACGQSASAHDERGGYDPRHGFRGWHERHHGFFGHRGPERGHDGGHACGPSGDGDDFGSFGVRRPLRFLAHKLELSEAQVSELAAVLNELKTERAQASVDYRRSTSFLADAVSDATFDEARATEAGTQRVQSAEKLREAVLRALKRIHGLLDEEQRKKLAYLLRTGILSM